MGARLRHGRRADRTCGNHCELFRDRLFHKPILAHRAPAATWISMPGRYI
jgi:hypothetical protein